MSDDLKQRLLFGPDFDTNATIPMFIGWYAEITSEAADRIELLEAELDKLKAAQYTIAQRSAQLGINKCKNATGARRQIEKFVSANLCADEILYAIAKEK